MENEKQILLREWNFGKNVEVSPKDVSYGSEKIIWWQCLECGHEWQAKCNSRTARSTMCPKCSRIGQKEKTLRTKIKKHGSLEERLPDLCNEWDFEKNGVKTPADYCAGSNEIKWWKCPVCSNSYQSRISSRLHGSACPGCASNRRIKTIIAKSGSLYDANSDLDKEWHPTKNGFLTTKDITVSSCKKYWWRCEKGHEWQASAATRIKGHGCPYCCGFYATKENNLAVLDFELAKEWHPTKNGELSPNDVSPYSSKKIWWKCVRGHEWQASVSNRYQGRGCAQCSAELKSSFPEQAIIFYLSKYFEVESRNKYAGWEIDVYLSKYNIGIEYDGIAYHSKKFLVEREKRKNEALSNSGIDLIRIKESTEKQGIEKQTVFFLVDSKYTNFKLALVMLFTMLSKKTGKKFNESFDVNSNRIEIMSQYMIIERKNSFAKHYPELVKFWNYERNLNLKPENFRFMSNRIVWWKCPICGGEWEESIINVSKGNRCPYCSNHKVLAGFNDLKTKNLLLSKEWYPTKNENLTTSEVTTGSNKKVWWKCQNGHEWRATVARRTSNTKCPYCNNTHKIIPLRNEDWFKRYEMAKEYYIQNGDLHVKATYVCDSGFKLGSWIRTQRVCNKNQDLVKERLELLEKIGMIWNLKPGIKKLSTHN